MIRKRAITLHVDIVIPLITLAILAFFVGALMLYAPKCVEWGKEDTTITWNGLVATPEFGATNDGGMTIDGDENFRFSFGAMQPHSIATTSDRFLEAPITLEIENRSGKPHKLIWEESSYILNDQSSRVVHKDTPFGKADERQPNSTLLPHTRIPEVIVPVQRIERNQFGGWDIQHISEPGTLELYLTIEDDEGEKALYSFTWMIENEIMELIRSKPVCKQWS